jgi:hypothetical protein
MSGEDNAHAPLRLIKRRVLINSVDRVSGSTTDFTIQLTPALENIVSSDWVVSSVTGYTVSIDELTSTGFTSGNTQYWRYIGETVNTRYNKTAEAFEEPRTYNRLTIRWRNGIASSSPVIPVPVAFPETTLELEFWEKV